MTNKELIEKLLEEDENKEVYFYVDGYMTEGLYGVEKVGINDSLEIVLTEKREIR